MRPNTKHFTFHVSLAVYYIGVKVTAVNIIIQVI